MNAGVHKLIVKLTAWADELVMLLPNIALALLVMICTWVGARLLARLVLRLLDRVSEHHALNRILAKLTRVVVWVLGIIVALQVLDLQKAATAALAGAGIVGLALGFAFQDLTANFISGVYLAVRRPMKVGDVVQSNGYSGRVHAIELRSTVIELFEGPLVRLPNRKIFEEALTNYTIQGRRRVDLKVGISYGDDLEKVKRVTLAAVSAAQHDPDRPPQLFFQEFGDSSINFVVQLWIPFRTQSDYLGALDQAVMAIKKAYDAEGITIPFPIRTLDFGIVGGEKLHEQLTTWSSGRPAPPGR